MPQLNLTENLDNGDFSLRIQLNIQAKIQMSQDYGNQVIAWLKQQPKWKQWLIVGGLVVLNTAIIIMVIFHHYFIGKLVEVSEDWKKFTYGKLILFTLVFFVGFPPLIGYSMLSMLGGMVYGCPGGWPLVASGTVAGSFASFLVFRYVLHDRAVGLINSNEKFRAFSEILDEKNALVLLILIRLCPLPYSLSNGALAAIPTLSPMTYLLASAITSPKVLIHLFVGYKLKSLGDDTKPTSSKIVDIVSIVVTLVAATTTTYVIYHKMQQKLNMYHDANHQDNTQDYDQMVFGNFDDLESGNIELNSTEFDADNFIIDDEDIANNNSNSQPDRDLQEFEIASDDDTTTPTNSRDY